MAHAMAAMVKPSGKNLDTEISWHPPIEGSVKLNTDGTVRSSIGIATAGGLIRNRLVTWLKVSSYNVGTVSVMQAELRGILISLHMAWSEGFKQVIHEVDFRAAVELLSKQYVQAN